MITPSAQDERPRTTSELIIRAFNQLFVSRRYDEISVGDIIGGAGVGRSTFYEHFRGKDDVLRSAVLIVLTPLADAVMDGCTLGAVRGTLEHIWQNQKSARPLLSGPSGAAVTQVLADLLALRLEDRCRRQGGAMAIPTALAAIQIAEGQFALIRAWLGGTAPCTADVLARAICRSSRGLAESLLEPAN